MGLWVALVVFKLHDKQSLHATQRVGYFFRPPFCHVRYVGRPPIGRPRTKKAKIILHRNGLPRHRHLRSLKVGKHGATKEEIAPAEKEQTENLCWKLPARELGIPVHVLVQRCHTDHAAPPSPQATAFPMKQKDKEGGGKRKRKEGRKEGRKEKGEEEGRKEGRKSTARNQHKRSKEE